MKLGKLSLVAVMALGTSAFAIDNTKVDGGVKFIYQTADWEMTSAEKASGLYETGLFKKGNLANALSGASYGGAASGGLSFTVGGTADLTTGVSAGAEVQGFTTLGLENNLVIGSMQGSRLDVDDAASMAQLWMAATLGKTTVKLGRMELDTPLAFTEKWNLIKNTFDAAVVLNNDLPDTTLVGAWVGKHNGDTTGAGYVAHLNTYTTFGVSGAYAFGAINKSIPNTTAQAWYYNVCDVADAFWLQADTKVMNMVNLGVQYANMDPKASGPQDSNIWAVKASADVAGFNVYAAYSDADKDGTASFANVSTNDKTKIYTGDGSIYMDGIVTRPGAEAFKIGASTGMIPGVKVAASYCDASDVSVQNHDISAWDVSASGKIGALGLTAIYTQVNNDTDGASQVYAGRDNDTLRLIATLAF